MDSQMEMRDEVITTLPLYNLKIKDEVTTKSLLYDDFYTTLFEYLQLKEKLRFSQTCTFLQSVFVKYLTIRMPRVLTPKLYMDIKTFSKNEMLYFWRYFGPLLESVQFVTITDSPVFNFNMRLFEAMQQYCTNLKRLQLFNVSGIKYINFLNADNLLSITEVNICSKNIFDDDIKPLIAIKNLKVLNLSTSQITGKDLIHMRKVTHLTLRSCRQITMQTLIEVCEALQLHHLDIQCCYWNNLNAIVEHCGELRVLRYSWNTAYDEKSHIGITTLPKLKSLTIFIRRWRPIPLNYFSSLADHHREDLEELHICTYFQSDKGMEPYKNSTHLEQPNHLRAKFQKCFHPFNDVDDCKKSILKFSCRIFGLSQGMDHKNVIQNSNQIIQS